MQTKRGCKRKSTGVVLTQRDLGIFKLLESIVVITRKSLQLFFEWQCTSDVNRRLSKLVEAGYLKRRFLPSHSGNGPAIYLLGPAGINEVQPPHGGELLIRRSQRIKKVAESQLRHELELSGFACRILKALQLGPDSGFLQWKAEDEIREMCNLQDEVGDVDLKPDAFLSYLVNQLQYNAFLEIDLGTEPLRRIAKKLHYYQAFRASGLFQSRFEQRAFRLLIVTNSTARMRNIAQLLFPCADLKVFVGTLSVTVEDLLFNPCWLSPGATREVALHEKRILIQGAQK